MILGPLLMVFPYSKQLFLYVIIWLIGSSTMNAYLKIDIYTATEKLITSYILQDFAAANIRFSKKTGSKVFINLKINLLKKKNKKQIKYEYSLKNIDILLEEYQ